MCRDHLRPRGPRATLWTSASSISRSVVNDTPGRRSIPADGFPPLRGWLRRWPCRRRADRTSGCGARCLGGAPTIRRRRARRSGRRGCDLLCVPFRDLDAQGRPLRAAGNVWPAGERLRETDDVGSFHLLRCPLRIRHGVLVEGLVRVISFQSVVKIRWCSASPRISTTAAYGARRTWCAVLLVEERLVSDVGAAAQHRDRRLGPERTVGYEPLIQPKLRCRPDHGERGHAVRLARSHGRVLVSKIIGSLSHAGLRAARRVRCQIDGDAATMLARPAEPKDGVIKAS